ncbi:uncharacterized protein RSE6_08908 [Rhynchosporium secalis]|uniref:Uncharacterized protein n=1 Tax=Rhynchosporium secalis TaxID=38038 RepID=A0A1E1MGK7_RHYSE|nr:uncharacterized protein RSE6_08908 [Rhynchosporium secalis]
MASTVSFTVSTNSILSPSVSPTSFLSLASSPTSILSLITTPTSIPLLTPVLAAGNRIWINNWCSYPLKITRPIGGPCANGAAGTCNDGSGVTTSTLAAGSTTGHGSTTSFTWLPLIKWEDSPTLFQISRAADAETSVNGSAHMELSYGLSFGDQLRYSWTAVGSAFANESTKVTPNGPGAGQGDCKTVSCAKDGLFCSDGHRLLKKPHMCGNQPQPFWVDLCSPEKEFKEHLARRNVAGNQH